MKLENIDWIIIFSFFILSLLIGLIVSVRSGRSVKDYFLSGRNMPWWLIGVSMVATTFSADTPNLVTDIVRKDGVSGNWVWWAFLLTGMLTTFLYAGLWRKSGVTTDLEFYELRYGGKAASFLRGFRAIYLGVIFNIIVMAAVSLAAVKIGSVLLGFSPVQTLLIASIVTVVYSFLGGLRGVIITDFFQFILAMAGTIWAAVYLVNLDEVGGMDNLLSHVDVKDKLNLLPDMNDTETFITLLIIPLAVQWWSSWYPGAEPGGGGYIAQRMLSAKNEKHAVLATLFFNIAHYALRPWPWILIALASLIVFPDLDSIKNAFPLIDETIIDDDLAYPAMLTYLPSGLLGLVIASLIAAFMSTISTHLNWGSSYVVNDVYKRFIKPEASEKEQVWVGKIATVFMMFLATLLALQLGSAKNAFEIIIMMGAGSGLLFILRWFWWRINAWSEITAMLVSFVTAMYFKLIHPIWFESIGGTNEYLIVVGLTTLAWVSVSYLVKPESDQVLFHFYKHIRPDGKGWDTIKAKAIEQGVVLEKNTEPKGSIGAGVLAMFFASLMVYGLLLGMGKYFYGEYQMAIALFGVSVVMAFLIYIMWPKLKF